MLDSGGSEVGMKYASLCQAAICLVAIGQSAPAEMINFAEHDSFFHSEWNELSGPDLRENTLHLKYYESPFGWKGWTNYHGTSELVIRNTGQLASQMRLAVKKCRSWHRRLDSVWVEEDRGSGKEREKRQVKNAIHVFVYNRDTRFDKVIPFLRFNEQWDADVKSWGVMPKDVVGGRFFSDIGGYDHKMAEDVPPLRCKFSPTRETAIVDASDVCCVLICEEDLKDFSLLDSFPLDEEDRQDLRFYVATEEGVVRWDVDIEPFWKRVENDE
jgi:hypothetical protein